MRKNHKFKEKRPDFFTFKKLTIFMDKRTKNIFRIAFGSIIITGAIFLTFKYLLKGPPFIKVLAIGLVAAVSYKVIDYISNKNKEEKV